MAEKFDKWYLPYLLAILMIGLPFSKAIASISEVALLVPLLLFRYHNFKTCLNAKTLPILAPLLLFGAYVFGMAYTTDWAKGLKVLNSQHSLLTIPLIVFLAKEEIALYHRRYLRYFAWAAAVAGGLTIALNMLPNPQLASFTAAIPFLEPFEGTSDRLAFGFYCPFHIKLQFANVLSLATLSTVYLYITHNRPANWLPLLLLLPAVAMVGGRGAQLAILAALLLWGLRIALQRAIPVLANLMGRPAAYGLVVAFFAAGAVLLPYILYQTVPAIHQRYNQFFWEMGTINDGTYVNYPYQEFTSLRRLVSMQNMWTVATQNPVLGTGTGDYAAALAQVYEADRFDLPVNNHSQYLHLLGMLGLLGLGIFTIMVAYWLWALRGRNNVYGFALAFMAFYLINMLPDAILLRQLDNMCFPLFMGIIAVLALQATPAAKNQKRALAQL